MSLKYARDIRNCVKLLSDVRLTMENPGPSSVRHTASIATWSVMDIKIVVRRRRCKVFQITECCLQN
jgi:hypothetical protein